MRVLLPMLLAGCAPSTVDFDDRTDTDTGAGSGEPWGTCGEGGPTGDHNEVEVDGGSYFVWAPADQDEPLPLVVGLHGDEGSPDAAISYIWGPVWESSQDFVLVLPQCPASNGSWWNSDHAEHAVFIGEVLADVAATQNIDPARAYAVGYSGGSTWLSWYGFEFQDVFAGIQWSCGGASPQYSSPPRNDCKVDGRFHIATDDFLWDGAVATADLMESNGHEVEFVEAPCSGHCCANTSDYAEDALDWMLGRTKCDAEGEGCGEIDDLP